MFYDRIISAQYKLDIKFGSNQKLIITAIREFMITIPNQHYRHDSDECTNLSKQKGRNINTINIHWNKNLKELEFTVKQLLYSKSYIIKD